MRLLTWLFVAMAATIVTLVPAMAADMANGDVSTIGEAETPLPLPLPLNGRAAPSFERPSWACDMLHRHGLRDVHGLSRVGDYWEAEARSGGREVVVYLIDNGTLVTHHYSRGAMAAAFGAMR